MPALPTAVEQNVNVEAYLTTQIGPGTTLANEIVSATTNVALLVSAATEVPLFTNLTLPAGTYYLVRYARND